MADKHPDYWKVKAAFFESRASVLEARMIIARSDAKFAGVMQAAGLDPKADYQLEDADESITPKGDVHPPIDTA